MTFIVEGHEDLKVRKQSLAVSQKTTAFSLESSAFYRYFRGKVLGRRVWKGSLLYNRFMEAPYSPTIDRPNAVMHRVRPDPDALRDD
jgi:hypothetical protein